MRVVLIAKVKRKKPTKKQIKKRAITSILHNYDDAYFTKRIKRKTP